MAYLRHVYRTSQLEDPSLLALFIEDTAWVTTEVCAEFAAAFLHSRVTLNPSREERASADLVVLAYRKATLGLGGILAWAKAQLSYAPVALSFFCIDNRCFEIVMVRDFGAWARRRRLQDWTLQGLRYLQHSRSLFTRLLRHSRYRLLRLQTRAEARRRMTRHSERQGT